MYVLGLSCASATFALQRGRLVPREWLAAKGYCDLPFNLIHTHRLHSCTSLGIHVHLTKVRSVRC